MKSETLTQQGGQRYGTNLRTIHLGQVGVYDFRWHCRIILLPVECTVVRIQIANQLIDLVDKCFVVEIMPIGREALYEQNGVRLGERYSQKVKHACRIPYRAHQRQLAMFVHGQAIGWMVANITIIGRAGALLFAEQDIAKLIVRRAASSGAKVFGKLTNRLLAHSFSQVAGKDVGKQCPPVPGEVGDSSELPGPPPPPLVVRSSKCTTWLRSLRSSDGTRTAVEAQRSSLSAMSGSKTSERGEVGSRNLPPLFMLLLALFSAIAASYSVPPSIRPSPALLMSSSSFDTFLHLVMCFSARAFSVCRSMSSVLPSCCSPPASPPAPPAAPPGIR
uniref:Uncharacterized protein n=1 Tax=Anopheles coluzzii TaxID=1518534 RepID=A0A8W7PT33_ANOCL